MMMNLFSVFDPSLSFFSFSWLIIFFLFFFFPSLYWLSGFYLFFVVKFLSLNILEVNYGLKKVSKGVYKFTFSVFFLIFLYNFLSIFPYLFSMTSHLLLTFPFSYVFWLGIVFFSFFKSLKNFLIHLIPVGTPLGLISFMVLVEILSNFIRPMALTFRLTANMMAGHLLLSLIGSSLISSSFFFFFFGCFFQMLLVFMELGVSLIQAYVFSTLVLLYLSESEESY